MSLKVLGSPGGIYKPDLVAGGEPISSLSAQYPVSQIARCAVGMRPEGVAANRSSSQITVEANGAEIFTGRGFAPRGRFSAASLDAGFSIIHPAIALDQGRAWAPGMHPLSTDHYTFVMGAGGTDVGDDSLWSDHRDFKFDLETSMAEAVPQFIIRLMEAAQTQRLDRELQNVGLSGGVASNNPGVIGALKNIIPITESMLDAGNITVSLANSANKFAKKVSANSITANNSAWDLLSVMFSGFGMVLICLPDGTVGACPDFSGCKPPDGNRITGDLVVSWEGSAEYTRSPSGVVVLSNGFDRTSGGVSPGGSPGGDNYGNYGEYMGGGTGGLFVTGLPAWMMPSQSGGQPQVAEQAVNNYAQQIYAEVRNMGRTFVVTTPMMPAARPGTTYFFEPISNAKNLTEGGDADTAFSEEYAGYCYKVVHSANANGTDFYTHFYFRNVFVPEDYDDMVDAAPFFGDEPFEVGSGGEEGVQGASGL